MTTYGKNQQSFYFRNKELRQKYYKEYYTNHKNKYKQRQIVNKSIINNRKGHKLPRTELVFSSQKKLKDYVKEQCLKYLDETIDIDHPLYNLLLDMWERHPNKSIESPLFKNISHKNRSPTFRSRSPLTKHEKFRSYYYDDGRWKSFSLLNKCVSGNKTTTTQQLNKTLRYAIIEQINDFKRQNDCSVCNICNCVKDDIEIDHIIEFQKIVKDFINDIGSEIEIIKGEGSGEWLFKDNDIKQKWLSFHLEKATLQALCVECHKGKK